MPQALRQGIAYRRPEVDPIVGARVGERRGLSAVLRDGDGELRLLLRTSTKSQVHCALSLGLSMGPKLGVSRCDVGQVARDL